MIRKRVTCAVMVKDGRLLLARRAAGQKHAGQWEFPGGKVEAGEGDAACLEREIWEEFGVRGQTGAHLCDSVCDYAELELQIVLCAYLFMSESDDFALRVHDAAAYFTEDEAKKLPLSVADVPIAEKAFQYLWKKCGTAD